MTATAPQCVKYLTDAPPFPVPLQLTAQWHSDNGQSQIRIRIRIRIPSSPARKLIEFKTVQNSS